MLCGIQDCPGIGTSTDGDDDAVDLFRVDILMYGVEDRNELVEYLSPPP